MARSMSIVCVWKQKRGHYLWKEVRLWATMGDNCSRETEYNGFTVLYVV